MKEESIMPYADPANIGLPGGEGALHVEGL